MRRRRRTAAGVNLRRRFYTNSWKRDPQIRGLIDRLIEMDYEVDDIVNNVADAWGDHEMQEEDHPIWVFVQDLVDDADSDYRGW